MGQGKGIKIKYRGVFCNNRENVYIYKHAFSADQAFILMCGQIARDLGVTNSFIINYFKGRENSYEITIETEYHEVKEGL